MNPLGEQVLLVTKQYLGPAAQQFLSKELRALECTADTITPWHLAALSERARTSAERFMDSERASEFAARPPRRGARGDDACPNDLRCARRDVSRAPRGGERRSRSHAATTCFLKSILFFWSTTMTRRPVGLSWDCRSTFVAKNKAR